MNKPHKCHDTIATSWMLRNDRKPFAVSHHIYADPEDREDILLASEWIYGHTGSDTVHQKIVWMLFLWAKAFRTERDAYETLLEYAKENDGFFPSREFISGIKERIIFIEKREHTNHRFRKRECNTPFFAGCLLL